MIPKLRDFFGNLFEKGNKKYWSSQVKVKWHPKPGTFSKGSPEEIAKEISQNYTVSLKTAMSRLNFAANRGGWCKEGGSGYNKKLCDKIQKAKEILRKKYVKKGEE